MQLTKFADLLDNVRLEGSRRARTKANRPTFHENFVRSVRVIDLDPLGRGAPRGDAPAIFEEVLAVVRTQHDERESLPPGETEHPKCDDGANIRLGSTRVLETDLVDLVPPVVQWPLLLAESECHA